MQSSLWQVIDGPIQEPVIVSSKDPSSHPNGSSTQSSAQSRWSRSSLRSAISMVLLVTVKKKRDTMLMKTVLLATTLMFKTHIQAIQTPQMRWTPSQARTIKGRYQFRMMALSTRTIRLSLDSGVAQITISRSWELSWALKKISLASQWVNSKVRWSRVWCNPIATNKWNVLMNKNSRWIRLSLESRTN